MESETKQKIIRELELMKGLETSAHNFYFKVAEHADLKQQWIKDAFGAVAKDEAKHIEMAQQLINLAQNGL